MGRKMIVISDDNEFVTSAKVFCESKGGTIKTYTTSEWGRQVNTPGFTHSLGGMEMPLSVGNQIPSEGAKILQFPTGGQGAMQGNNRVATMNELESVAIRNAIHNFNGNLTEAAKALGIGRATLYRKVKQYNIDPAMARKRKAA